MKSRYLLAALVFGWSLMVAGNTSTHAAPMGTAFTYQGRFIDGGNPANGIVTKFEYYTPAEGGALKKSISDFGINPENLNLTTEVTYDAVGNVITVTDAQNNVSQSEYFPSRRLKKTTSPAPFNYETHYDYDEDGKLIRTEQQMGTDLWQVMEYTYTPSGEHATVRGPYKLGEPTQENFTQFTYDALDRLWLVTDAENNVTETLYYPDGQIWKTIDAEAHDVITNTYNADGTLYDIQDARGNPTIYDYDDFKRPWRTFYADNTYEEIIYDNFGRVYQTRTRNADITQLTYDALNRTVSKTIAGNTTTYGYDISSRTVTTTDNAGSLRSTYDRIGRADTTTQSNGAQVSYLYDTLSRRTRLTCPNDSYITYHYDSLGRLTDIKDQSGVNIASYGYDDLSRRVSVLYANGTSAAYTYSSTNRLTQLSNATTTQPSTYDYTYDLVGNRMTMLVNGTDQHIYTYDNIYQLTHVNYPDGYFQSDTTFTYDPAGNRSQVDNPPSTYITNILNQYTNVGAAALSYDNNGNLTSDGTSTYTYDAENQLITAQTGLGQTVQYTYDAAGRRIRKDVDGRITQYVYDGDQVIAEYDGSDNLLREFVYGPGIDEPIRMHAYNFIVGDITGDGVLNIDDFLSLAQKWLLTNQDIGYDSLYDLNQDGKINNADTDLLAAQWLKTAVPLQIFYYHFDGLGSVIALSDASGNVVESYTYNVYGQSQPSAPATGNPYRFTARRWDPETNLYYYRSRYYNPTIGRFMQTDPIGYADGINWYAYCGNNPIVLVDPSGLCYKPTAGEWAVGVASGIGQGLLNTVQGLQDTAIGTVNLATGWVGSVDMYTGRFMGLNNVIPAIPSPQWARDVFVKESDFAYNAEKFVTSTAATVGVGAIIKAAGAGNAGSKAASGGRLGNAATRAHVKDVAAELRSRGWEMTHGGGIGPEEFLRGPTGRLGSNYVDITAVKNSRTLRINTIDTLTDGVTPTAREAAAAAAIRAKTPGEHLLLIPKPKH